MTALTPDTVPPDLHAALHELDFVWHEEPLSRYRATNAEFEVWVTMQIPFAPKPVPVEQVIVHLCASLDQYPVWIPYEGAVDLRETLDDLDYPVDAILRYKRLRALIA